MHKAERNLLLATLAIVITALALTAQLVRHTLTDNLLPVQSLENVYQQDLAATRILTGVLLIIGWPLLLRMAAGLLKIRFNRPSRFLTLLGFLFGGVAYSLSFLPWPGLTAAILVPGALSLVLLHGILRISWKQTFAFWIVQGTSAVLLASTAVWGLESLSAGALLNPTREWPPIYRIAIRTPLAMQQVWPGQSESAFPPLLWEPTGSRWLDYRANRVRLEVHNPDRSGEWAVSLHVEQPGPPMEVRRSPGDPSHALDFVARPKTLHLIDIKPHGFQKGDAARVWSLLPLKTH